MVDLNSINKHHLWYIVGLIATDGNLSSDGRHLNITSKDRKFLFSVRNALGLDNKIGLKARGGSKNKIYSNFQFGDVKFYRFLQSIGLTAKKSLTMGAIKVDDGYFEDFLRGVIDGDGCISTWIHKTNFHRQWSSRVTSGAPIFISWLKDEIETRFGVSGRLHRAESSYRPNPLYTLKFGKMPTHVILKKIYYKNCLALNRKHRQSTLCLQDENKFVKYGQVIKGPGAVIGSQSGLKIR